MRIEAVLTEPSLVPGSEQAAFQTLNTSQLRIETAFNACS